MSNHNEEFLKFIPLGYLRNIRLTSIESDDQVSVKNTKCPHCNNILTISEAFTKPCVLPIGLVIPTFDEDGVIIGECTKCNKELAADVTNPELSEFRIGAIKKDFYFNADGKDKEDFYKNLLRSTTRIEGDEKLNQYYLNYIYDDTPLYVCNQCGENLEHLSLNAFKEKFDLFEIEHSKYISWSLKNAFGKSPEYIIVKLDFRCSCGNNCKSFFFKKYLETVSVDIDAFSICNIIGSQNIERRIMSGVYTKDNSVSWLFKLIPRWTLLFNKVYIITPFIGHQWLKPAELVDIWLELLNRLDHKKSKIIIKSGQFSIFKKAYSKENDISYEILNEFKLGSDLLSELKQTNDFHAKIYCGVSQERCEVLSGSANLVKGKSKEVIHFNVMDNFNQFNEAFLIPLGLNENLDFTTSEHSLFFDSDKEFSLFTGKSTIDSSEYHDTILFDS